MRAHFDDAWVHGYQGLISALELPDPGDRHVLAAAVRCGAQHIVTRNLKHFPRNVLEAFDMEAIDPDEFLFRTFQLYPASALSVFRRMRAEYRAS